MWKQAAAMGVGLIVGIGVAAMIRAKAAPPQQPVPQVVRAQRFELVDQAGNLQASLGIDDAVFGLKGKMTLLVLYSKHAQGRPAKAVMAIGVTSEGEQAILMGNPPQDGAGIPKTALGLLVTADAVQTLFMSSPLNQNYVALKSPFNEAPSLLLSRAGKARTIEP